MKAVVCKVWGPPESLVIEDGAPLVAEPGKVVVLGTQQVMDEKVFVLAFLQGRRPEWVGRPFFARFDPKATWLDQLRPALGEERFFFDEADEPERAHVVAWE